MSESSFHKKPKEEAPVEPNLDCPRCGDKVIVLHRVEAGMRLALQKENIHDVQNEVCDHCYSELERALSKGAKLRAEAIARDQQRLYLWKNRTNLIKQARALMSQKIYSEAAINYEKYLKILEVIYQCGHAGLKPEMFKGRPTELTVIASVYWDLLRVYDTHPKYADRQKESAIKLAEFIRFTPLLPEVARKAQNLSRSGKNPEAFKLFLKKTDQVTARCFIASAAFENLNDPAVVQLRQFRDDALKSSRFGRAIVLHYYRWSPPFARLLNHMRWLKPLMRTVLRGVAWFTKF